MGESKRIVEIAGVKMEVDLREAKTLESYKVGDNVKVLIRKYNDNYESYPGVIVGFDAFEKLPTIIIAYLTEGYDPDLKFAYLNEQSKDIEITHAQPEEVILKKEDVISQFDKKISEKELELTEIKKKKDYFIKYFNQYFRK
ncbi:MAG: hypothetical protein ACTSPI_00935 [Candidatus Heimdallarchaeaceae archaeon]